MTHNTCSNSNSQLSMQVESHRQAFEKDPFPSLYGWTMLNAFHVLVLEHLIIYIVLAKEPSNVWCWHLRQDICTDLKASKSQHPASWISKKTFDCQLTFNVYPCLSQQGPLRRRNSRDPWAVLPLLSLRAERCMKTKPDPCCLHLLTCFRQSLQTFRCKSTETDCYNFIDKPYTAPAICKTSRQVYVLQLVTAGAAHSTRGCGAQAGGASASQSGAMSRCVRCDVTNVYKCHMPHMSHMWCYDVPRYVTVGLISCVRHCSAGSTMQGAAGATSEGKGCREKAVNVNAAQICPDLPSMLNDMKKQVTSGKMNKDEHAFFNGKGTTPTECNSKVLFCGTWE